MKKAILGCIMCFTLLTTKAIKVKFIVANTSVNVAEGSTGIFTAFQLRSNSYINPDTTNAVGLIDFPSIIYNNIKEVVIEKTVLNGKSAPIFSKLTGFPLTTNATYGSNDDKNFIQGTTYAYRLVVITNTGQQLNLIQKAVTATIANPKMNCAKLNNVYRLAGHNNFQESVISPQNGGFYRTMDFTRVVELDVHPSNNSTTWNWDVRHIGSGNKNNCGYGTAGDNPFGICIDDIKQWHLAHPNHDVIILFIDLKLKHGWNENNNNQTPGDLDQKLLALVPNADMIYKPRDLLGNNLSSNFGNMRLAAQQNNWPSMGDLTGKFIFVLTGNGDRITDYITDRIPYGPVAFCAAKVKEVADVADLTRTEPDIGWWAVNDIVFYNHKFGDISNGASYFASGKRYVNRVWKGNLLGPITLNNGQYADAIDEDINNIATKLVWVTPNPTNGKLINGIQRPIRAETPLINGSRVYSTYENVTQAATDHIIATNLIVEQGAHYRMFANDYIDLQPNVDFQSGSNVDVRIDDCKYANYNLRQSAVEQLTQEEIDALMHQLDKELYNYSPEDEKEIVNLAVYPNPTNSVINISYTNFLLSPTIFTLYDLTGRVVVSKTCQAQNDGSQVFSVNVSSLNEGTYFYTLQVGQKTYNGKIVKMGY